MIAVENRRKPSTPGNVSYIGISFNSGVSQVSDQIRFCSVISGHIHSLSPLPTSHASKKENHEKDFLKKKNLKAFEIQQTTEKNYFRI